MGSAMGAKQFRRGREVAQRKAPGQMEPGRSLGYDGLFRPIVWRESIQHCCGDAVSIASIARRSAGDASSNLSAVFVAQELNRTISTSGRRLMPKRPLGEISSTRQRSGIRAAATELVPFSYFCICWKATPIALPSSVWFIPNFNRRMRIVTPMISSTLPLRARISKPFRFKPNQANLPILTRKCNLQLRHAVHTKERVRSRPRK
jgi:hypothetical protein